MTETDKKLPKDTREQWDKTVSSYFEAEDMTNEQVNFPAIMRGVGDVRGKIVLDFGCGNGRFARKIKDMGASKVIGVDIAPAMIELAKQDNSDPQIEYYANPDNTLSVLPDGSVDKVIANLVFMMSPNKEEIGKAMKEIQRVLKPGGTFAYLVTHSAFIERGAFDYRNEFDGPFDYMAEGKPYKFILIDAQGKEIDEDFYDYHYSLSTYINTTIHAGFNLTGVEEITYPAEVAKKYGITDKFLRYPQAMVIVGEKPKQTLSFNKE